MTPFRPRTTRALRILLGALVSIFVIQNIFDQFTNFPFTRVFGFTPDSLFHGYVWQLVTYAFLHGGLTHLFFNGLMIYMLGADLEQRWGTAYFLKYFFLCALGGAVVHTLFWFVWPESLGVVTIGASGAVYGLLYAFAKFQGNAQVLVFFVIPMKARLFVTLLAVMEIFSAIFYTNSGIAHLVHLGGLATGALLLWKPRRKRPMSRQEVKARMSVIIDNTKGDKKYPDHWN